MLRLRNWQGAAVVLACWGLLVPQTSVLADASAAVPAVQQKTSDVALTANGMLVGAAFLPNGKHLDGATVVISQGNQEIVRTNTDTNGAFAIAQMKTGSYQIAIGNKAAPIRVWNAQAAPPKAKQKAILVVGEVVRGQGEYYEYCPDGDCPPGGVMGLDFITLLTVGAATTAAVVTIINLDKLNDIEDCCDSLRSP
jgi:hypothetical protein